MSAKIEPKFVQLIENSSANTSQIRAIGWKFNPKSDPVTEAHRGTPPSPPPLLGQGIVLYGPGLGFSGGPAYKHCLNPMVFMLRLPRPSGWKPF